jgi:hypothetical protein
MEDRKMIPPIACLKFSGERFELGFIFLPYIFLS